MHESLQYDFSIDLCDNELSRNKNGLKEYGGLRLLEKDVQISDYERQSPNKVGSWES
jgi:hypothetical protein